MKRLGLALIALLASAVVSLAQTSEPDSGPNPIAQAAADGLRDFTGADGAFLAAGLLKSGATKDNLASVLSYPTDTPVVVTLTGAQVRQAIERSISLYPQPSSFFLQLSGFEVTFKKDATASPRILSLTANGAKVSDVATYNVAMPSQLARGALGYFKIWDKDRISRTFTATMDSVLKGRRYAETAPRYTIVD